MPETNPTVVFTEPRTAVVEERDIPSPGPGHLLVRTRRTLISTGTELTIAGGTVDAPLVELKQAWEAPLDW